MKQILQSSLVLFFIISLFGCKGDTGPTGPTGNANVRSIQVVVYDVFWTDASTGVIYYNENTKLITSDIASHGTVLVYYLLNNGGWAPLPNGFVNDNEQTYGVNFVYTTGLVEFIESSSTISNDGLKITQTFKVVVVDGTASLAKIDVQNYEEVKKAFNLED
jgi:hypothetical protein